MATMSTDQNDPDEHDAEWFALYFPMTPIDLGDGTHRAGWTDDGNLYWLHRCTSPRPRWGLGTIDVTSGTKHKLRHRDPLYVEGSILCVACGDHGFINHGKWKAAD